MDTFVFSASENPSPANGPAGAEKILKHNVLGGFAQAPSCPRAPERTQDIGLSLGRLQCFGSLLC